MLLGRRIGLLAAFFLSLNFVTATALVRFDFEQKFFNEPGQPVLDHSVVLADGIYHLFYLRGSPAINVGHATTTDFIHWTIQPPVLQRGTTWNRLLWAPHVYWGNGQWNMFYTAVANTGTQQTGVAFSTDLYNWVMLDYPIYHPDPSWAEWSPDYFTHGRDPHVMEYNGKYYQFLTAKTWNNRGAVAMGESTDLINWVDIGPVYTHNIWHVLESVFVFKHNTKWQMMFTEEVVLGVSVMNSDDLFTGWDIATRNVIDPGHAPQATLLPNGERMFSRHTIYQHPYGEYLYNIRFDSLTWVGDVPLPSKPWPLAKDWEIVSGNAFDVQPTYHNNMLARGDSTATNHIGECWIGTYEHFNGPLGIGDVGEFQGDEPKGKIRSRPFVIWGNSMSLLVGGGNYPSSCYVALIDASNGSVLYKETGNGVDTMDRRYWNLVPHVGKTAYIEIVDESNGFMGHINVDDIIESSDFIENPDDGNGTVKDRPGRQAPQPALLEQNTPNPFNPSTTISYDVLDPGRVRIDIFDVSGRFVRTLVNEPRVAGTYRAAWDGTDDAGALVTSGVYFYRLSMDGVPVTTRKMTLLK